MNIEQIKVRREGREGEAWAKTRTGIETCSGEHVCVAPLGFKNRIINVPELEDALIEAVELLRDVLDEVSSNLDGYYAPYQNVELAEKFLERFK